MNFKQLKPETKTALRAFGAKAHAMQAAVPRPEVLTAKAGREVAKAKAKTKTKTKTGAPTKSPQGKGKKPR